MLTVCDPMITTDIHSCRFSMPPDLKNYWKRFTSEFQATSRDFARFPQVEVLRGRELTVKPCTDRECAERAHVLDVVRVAHVGVEVVDGHRDEVALGARDRRALEMLQAHVVGQLESNRRLQREEGVIERKLHRAICQLFDAWPIKRPFKAINITSN